MANFTLCLMGFVKSLTGTYHTVITVNKYAVTSIENPVATLRKEYINQIQGTQMTDGGSTGTQTERELSHDGRMKIQQQSVYISVLLA